jgi:tetratricopeptide (TPR) repeat protein
MSFFNIFKKSAKQSFRITETDKKWVEDNFSWLIKCFGIPDPELEEFLFTDKFFPRTYQTNGKDILAMIDDFCELVNIDSDKIEIEYHKDLRDSYGIAYGHEGEVFEMDTQVFEDKYRIHVAKSVEKRPERLLYLLIFQFSIMSCAEIGVDISDDLDKEVLIILIGIYFGFGIPISQRLRDRGTMNEGFWTTKWRHDSIMPDEVMAYALAVYSKIHQPDTPSWSELLPPTLKGQFLEALEYFEKNNVELLPQHEKDALGYLNKAYISMKEHDFAAALARQKKALFLSQDPIIKSSLYNGIGYCLTRLGDYQSSLSYFDKAIELDPKFAYPHDNLGYALIILDRLEEGKKHLTDALNLDGNDDAYSYRNLAVYHEKKGNIEEANKNFELALSLKKSVDLLEFHYGKFLLAKGNMEEGKSWIQKAKDKGEPEAKEIDIT